MNIPELTDAQRSVFYPQVWEVVRLIPPGRVASYGQVAAWTACPSGVDADAYQAFRARWAGQAMAACPADVPWQRVINAQGKVSSRGGAGAATQRLLLEAEGVIFDARERVDLKRFGWAGPPRAWLEAHGFDAGDEPYLQESLL